jgi:biopolymer transport protein ExbD/biopolymer transport protein TolR
MGSGIVCSKRGVVSEVNVVPLIDILLVLLVIFMIMPHRQMGLMTELPQPATPLITVEPTGNIIVQIAPDGSLRINQSVVQLDELRARLESVLAPRARRVAFLQGDGSLEFQAVAQVLDTMHAAGASPVGLLTSELEKNR